jgi:hypothetical protein
MKIKQSSYLLPGFPALQYGGRGAGEKLSNRGLLLWGTVCDTPGSGVALSFRFPPSRPSFVGVPDRELAPLLPS